MKKLISLFLTLFAVGGASANIDPGFISEVRGLESSTGVTFINAPSVAVTSGYNGEVADVIMRALKVGNETVDKGSVYVEPGVQERLAIPILTTAADKLVPSVADPTVAAEAFVWTENTIVPASCMFFDLINPRHFESVWRPFQPVGPLVDRVDNPKITAALTEEAMKTVATQISKLIWQGDTAGAADLLLFDGFLKKFLADASVIDVVNQGVITAANVIAILEATEAAIPSTIWNDPSVVFHMNTTDYRLYLQAARALDFKGANIGEAGEARFAGREIRFYDGMKKNSIVVAKATAGRDSNLWAGVDVAADPETVKIERYRPESERFIVKILFKYGVGYGIGSEIVLYTGV